MRGKKRGEGRGRRRKKMRRGGGEENEKRASSKCIVTTWCNHTTHTPVGRTAVQSLP